LIYSAGAEGDGTRGFQRFASPRGDGELASRSILIQAARLAQPMVGRTWDTLAAQVPAWAASSVPAPVFLLLLAPGRLNVFIAASVPIRTFFSDAVLSP
jgi:hypothetical protein